VVTPITTIYEKLKEARFHPFARHGRDVFETLFLKEAGP
jgi:hypothetical protein